MARPRCGVEPTTPAMGRPSRRSASAWTGPMNPVPTMQAWCGWLMAASPFCRKAGRGAGRGLEYDCPDQPGRKATMPQERSLDYRPQLDTLRFLAFLVVFLYHADGARFPYG